LIQCLRAKHLGGFGLAIIVAMGAAGTTESLAQNYTIATSPPGGAWYAQAVGLSTVLNRDVPGINVTVEGTGGGNVNTKWMSAGTVDFAFGSTDMLHFAREGQAPYDRVYDMSGVRSVFLMQSSPSQVVVRADSNIRSMADLKGKRVAMGGRGSAALIRAYWVMEAAGINKGDFEEQAIGYDEGAKALTDRRIDGMVVLFSVPSPVMLSLQATTDLRFLELTEAQGKALSDKYPMMAAEEIPANSYKGQTKPLIGYGIPGTFVVQAKVSDEHVYRGCLAIAKAIKGELLQVHKDFGQWKASKEIERVSGLKLHDGARRCYKELGVL
jgi:TRAP transporter TAXI family solute receptor